MTVNGMPKDTPSQHAKKDLHPTPEHSPLYPRNSLIPSSCQMEKQAINQHGYYYYSNNLIMPRKY